MLCDFFMENFTKECFMLKNKSLTQKGFFNKKSITLIVASVVCMSISVAGYFRMFFGQVKGEKTK